MEIRDNQMVILYLQELDNLPVVAWVKSLSTKPGSVSVLCTTTDVWEGTVNRRSFERDISDLEVVNASEILKKTEGDAREVSHVG